MLVVGYSLSGSVMENIALSRPPPTPLFIFLLVLCFHKMYNLGGLTKSKAIGGKTSEKLKKLPSESENLKVQAVKKKKVLKSITFFNITHITKCYSLQNFHFFVIAPNYCKIKSYNDYFVICFCVSIIMSGLLMQHKTQPYLKK